jgi:hypothetical protein
MFIKIERLLDGPGPSDVIVSFKTADGKVEEVVVNKGSLNGDLLDVGPILYKNEGRVLIELPRESSSGQGRIWVPDSEIKELQAA